MTGQTDAEVTLLPGTMEGVSGRVVWLVTFFAFVAAALAAYWSGLVVFMGDSYLLADRAKHLIQAGNLDVNNSLGGLIYPPLYAIVISPAYLSSNPAITFRVILFIQSLLLASQVWPFYKLLVAYCRLTQRPAAWLAGFLALAPATLPYTYMFQTEVLYFPLLLWTTYFLLQASTWARRLDFVAFGLGLGFILLTRSAASTVLVASVLTAGLQLWLNRRNPNVLRAKLSGFAWAGLALVATYGSWKVYERLFVHYQSYAPYFTWEQLKPIFTQREVFDIHFAWLANAAFYYLMSPLSIAGCFVLVLCFRNYKTLLRDPLAPFALAVMAVSAVTVVVVMDTHYGGRDLTWNKYLMPYVSYLSLIALRYRRHLTASNVNICGIILALTFMALRPSQLGCHFEDALYLFVNHSHAYQFPEAFSNGLFALAIFVPACLWSRHGRVSKERARAAAITIATAFWFIADVGPAWFYRHSGDLNVTNYDGAAKKALEFSDSHPDTQAYYDPGFAAKDPFGALKVLFYWPRIIGPRTPSELSQLPKSIANVVYFTGQDVANFTPIGQDRGAVNVYLLHSLNPASDFRAARLSLTFGPAVWASEVSTFNGRQYKVRWLQRSTEFQISNSGPEQDAMIQLDLATFGGPHTARLEVNGVGAPETHSVNRVFWEQGPETASYRIHMRSGTNAVQLLSPEPPAVLPGGRQVSFLLVGDIRIVPLAP